jgi:hypothetical protein
MFSYFFTSLFMTDANHCEIQYAHLLPYLL